MSRPRIYILSAAWLVWVASAVAHSPPTAWVALVLLTAGVVVMFAGRTTR
jgi:hypothetical protein